MGYFIDNMRRRQPDPRDFMMDGWGFTAAQEIENKQKAAQPQSAVEQPKVDTSNAIGSLADLLGPTPAEREAQQARLERGRQQMTMWTGLIDGLRQLGNLYYTAQGARPQQFNDPYKMVDDTYQREAKRLDDLTAYNLQYAQQLYALQRQSMQDAIAKANYESMNEYRKAQIRNYEASDERQQRQLEERQRQFDEKQAQQQAQFESRQKQQQAQFGARQRQQQAQFEARQKNKEGNNTKPKRVRGFGSNTSQSTTTQRSKGRAY